MRFFLIQRNEIGLLEGIDFGQPAGLDKGEVIWVGGVGVVVGLAGEAHGDAEGVVELWADLAAHGKVAHAGNGDERCGSGEEGGLFGGARRVLQAEGDGVFDHDLRAANFSVVTGQLGRGWRSGGGVKIGGP
jgi:hypothetical protein